MKTLEQLIADAQAQRAAAIEAERRMDEQRRNDARRMAQDRFQQDMERGLDATFLELLDVQYGTQDAFPQTYAEFMFRDWAFWLWHYTDSNRRESGWGVGLRGRAQAVSVAEQGRTPQQITELILCAIGDILDAVRP